MAEIRPIRAWRYNPNISENIEELTSPLFDVVSEKQRKQLYSNPYSSIHLSVPKGENPALEAQRTLQTWKDEKIILQDNLPGIYVYYQYFKLPGQSKEFCRKGFICHIRTYDWSENVILRHENTIPKAVNDRIELLEKTQLHASATHGLYTDESHVLEKYMDEAIQNPVYDVEDYQGVRDVSAVIHDAKVIQLFIEVLKNKKIILADGHHRYEGSLAYSLQKQKESNGQEGHNFHLMYLTNSESDDLRILPTHRLISYLPNFDQDGIIKKFEEHFIIKPIPDADTINEIIHGKPWAFGVIFKDRAIKIRLKPESLQSLNWKFPDEVKRLDLTVLHYFVIEQVLGIKGKDQRSSEYLSFDRSFSDCHAKVLTGEAQMALITQEISIEDVKRVCQTGFTMPQKSTYFYPKVICGFLFSSIKEDEFQTPDYSRF